MNRCALRPKKRAGREMRGQVAIIILVAALLVIKVTSASAQEIGSPTDAPSNEPAAQDLPFDSAQPDWRSADLGGVTVFWAGGDDAPGEAALGIAEETLRQLDLILPVAGADQTSVYVFPTTAELRTALQSAGLEWSGDLGDLQSDDVWVTAINPRTAQQELARSIPRQMISRRLAALESHSRAALPAWFLIGLPGLFEEAGASGYDGAVREALESRQLIPLAQLCDAFPSVEDARSLATAESVSLLSYIRTRYGAEALGRLVSAYVAGEQCTTGITRALGLSAQQLEEEWLAARYGRVSLGIFWRSNAPWLLLLLIGFLMSGLLLLPVRRLTGDEL